MPFCDAVELFGYWSKNPPLHLMVRDYLGYKEPEPNAMEVAQMLQSVGVRGGKAPKLNQAPERDRQIFEEQKKRAGSNPTRRR